jgi:Zn finger protein HypA/HybF involved in hydrogenase expression
MSFDRLGDHKREQAGELFRLGRTCVKTGDKTLGRQHLLKAVEYDPQHSDAWMWLSATTDDVAEQRKYLEWAIAAQPSNAQARRGWALLTGQLKKEEVLAEGASVAARQPAEAEPVRVRQTFDCPQCGGRLRFDPELIDLKCENCGLVEVVDEALLKDGARPLDFILPTERGQRWAEGERLFTCQQCSATSILPVGHQSAVCPFCGNAALVQALEEANLITPQGLIPMGFEAEKAYTLAREWLGQGWFTPGDLQKLVRNKQLYPAYVPFWVFEANLTAKWGAEVQEGYGKEERWVWRTGDYTFFYTDQLVPACTVMPSGWQKRLPKFDLKQLIQFKSEYLADWPAAMYTLSLADASLRAREQMVKDARRDVRDKVASGRAVRNLQLTTDSFSGELYKLILLPLWIGTYHYGQHQYRVIINGQTGQVAGDKPLDMPLVTFFILTVLLFLGVLSALMFVMLR